MTDLPGYPTDAAICRLLADAPLPTAAIASHLAIPERTVRHRLLRLREAGDVVSGIDGLHRLAEAVLPAAQVELPLPTAAARGRWTMTRVLAAAGFGLAVAGFGLIVLRRSAAPQSPPAPPPQPDPWSGYPGNGWQGLPW